MRQELVEVHRADDGADIGHGQDHQRVVERGDLVTGLGRVEHLEEGGGIDAHAGIVLGDRLLRGNVEHLLHDIHLVPDAVDPGPDQAETGTQRARIAAEALDGVIIALRDGADAEADRHDDHHDDDDHGDIEARQVHRVPQRRGAPSCSCSPQTGVCEGRMQAQVMQGEPSATTARPEIDVSSVSRWYRSAPACATPPSRPRARTDRW